MTDPRQKLTPSGTQAHPEDIDPVAWSLAVKSEYDGRPLWVALADNERHFILARAVVRAYVKALAAAG